MTTDEFRKLDQAYVWHPFTPMSVWLDDEPVVIERGEGCELIDTDGNRYLDGVSSLWVNVHGHGHPTINAAIRDQLNWIAHSTFLGLTHPAAVELAAELVAIAPGRLSRVFYSENGAAAVEVALKMAYSYWRNQGAGEGQRDRFVRLENAYHGDTIGAVSVGGIDRFHDTYRPLLFSTADIPSPYCYRCPLGLEYPSCDLACANALDAVLTREGDRIAAVVVEPMVQGAAGMITAPDGHLARIAEIARRHGVLLVVDEVATGFGRTGHMFASEIDGVEPDIMCLAKGITGGYLPLSATLATEVIFEAFLGAPEEHKTLYHGHSYSANPLCCAAALANLQVFEDERTLEAIQPKIALLADLLAPLRDHPNVGDVRQRGLMVGIELVAERATKEPFAEALQVGADVTRRARPKGVIVRPLGDVVVLMPPLAITDDQLTRLVGAVAEAIDEACTAAA
ncbi:MAG TPA: adenosylmethionine--8-amino-7-oxononanoate transaminase [Acidimicrobiia bacterium]|nr:adenosylmethionine--8-amino-7-oxononanoate transaminase [Acidimicrobiia bacterium]